MNSALSSPKKELKNCSFNFIFSMFLCMYLSYMIRNRSQKFWDIYQGYLLTFEQGDLAFVAWIQQQSLKLGIHGKSIKFSLSLLRWRYCQATQEIIMIKGHLISKCLFGVFNFLQKTNENKSIWGFIVVK